MTCPTCGRPQLTEPRGPEAPRIPITRDKTSRPSTLSPKTHRDPPTSPPPRTPFRDEWSDGRDSRYHLLDPDPLRPPEPLDEADDMCPNCLTPWKCNGPHLADQTPYRQRLVEPMPDELAFAWRSCLVRLALFALALILVGLAVVLMGRAG